VDELTFSPRSADGVLPSYERLFGDLDFRGADESRSVYSPAAYLADLLQLLDDHFDDPALGRRRPGIEQVPLDADNTSTELPYLDIVNEVLAGAIDAADAYEKLRKLWAPIGMPFSLRHERLKTYLEQLRVGPAELYSRFATPADPDTVARLHLGLSREDVHALTTPIPAEPDDDGARRWYRLDSDGLGHLDVDAFRRALSLSAAEVRELLFQNLGPAR
jgi:Salmonella virulence plasmid 28.1kDa A protein